MGFRYPHVASTLEASRAYKIIACALRASRRYPRWYSGPQVSLSQIMRVLFLDYGLAPPRRAALLARKLVRSWVQVAVVPLLLPCGANFRD
jgi:hypothetical protein